MIFGVELRVYGGVLRTRRDQEHLIGVPFLTCGNKASRSFMRCLMRWLIPRDESMSTLCLFLGFFVTGVWSSSTSISSALRFPFAFFDSFNRDAIFANTDSEVTSRDQKMQRTDDRLRTRWLSRRPLTFSRCYVSGPCKRPDKRRECMSGNLGLLLGPNHRHPSRHYTLPP